MKKLIIILITIISGHVFIGCSDDFLDKQPQNILSLETVWANEDLVISLLGDLYNRVPKGAFSQNDMQLTNEAIWSGGGNGLNGGGDFGTGLYQYWDYSLIREINLFIENAANSTLDESVLTGLVAEARFIRASVYFEMVKRMGGVPIITQTFSYEGSSEEDLQFPRNTEAEVYDFIASEIDAIKDDLADSGAEIRRASRWAALALKSRAMLFAGSIAKYNNTLPSPINLPGEEVGISAGRADGYFQASLEASNEIINSGNFSLHNDYYDLFSTSNKGLVSETIFVDDFRNPVKRSWFTYWNTAPTNREDDNGGNLSPVLEVVEAYDYLDGTSGELKMEDGLGNPIYYDNPEDIFANKDLRLNSTIVLPNTQFRGAKVEIQAGIIQWNGASYDTLITANLGDRDADNNIITGQDGPSDEAGVTNSGFYIKKFVTEAPGAGSRTVLADNWWIVYRYGEILLNAAEASFELGQSGPALTHVNAVRERAGFGANSLGSINIDAIRKERRVELAYEGHLYWDLKRWRTAHLEFNGVKRPTGAYPYLVLHEGETFHKKYVYVKKPLSRLGTNPARNFRADVNYYSEIPGSALANNPKLVKNPNH
ncbi:RagB/SusD family nutrient uptake outer membrane protein [Fulvivirgaceae bacterium BMA10]|uniref:RagB/SusD family nutrient uptake outer membrane protein n=1 Tax=Splendidivirga corallicola TaxID=3051826 RepID=A0ABT8KN89_9BACT|nr:RagB/SusD family nutrient uptake outer membrane protein [Fulvivirgaceae bacterium BMA10]